MHITTSIDFLAYAKIMHWVRKAKNLEVSGFGKILRVGSHLHVTDAFLLKQVNTGVSTVLDADAIGRAMYEYRNEPGDLNFWWHSHHTMSAYFSPTDYDTIRDLGGNGWLLATVFNTQEQMRTALYTASPIGFITEGLDLRIGGVELPESAKATLDAQYLQTVTEEPFSSTQPGLLPLSRKERKRQARLERLRDLHEFGWIRDEDDEVVDLDAIVRRV